MSTMGISATVQNATSVATASAATLPPAAPPNSFTACTATKVAKSSTNTPIAVCDTSLMNFL